MPIHLLPGAAPPTRRDFLALGGASLLGVAGTAPGKNEPNVGNVPGAKQSQFDGDAPARNKADWYAWAADTHIAADAKAIIRNQNMAQNLRAVAADILGQPDAPRGVFIDGDLALKNGQAGDYRTLLDLTEPLRAAKLPLHLALGNHDDRAHFRQVLAAEPPLDADVLDKHASIVEGPGPRFIVLDSLDKVDVTPGLLGDRQRAWLARTLDAEPETPTILFVHHNLSHHDGALTDTEALLKLIRPRRQVKAVVYGHSHRWERAEDEGLHLINLPAVGYPFAADQPIGWCKFSPTDVGAELELKSIRSDRSKHGERVPLRWRSA